MTTPPYAPDSAPQAGPAWAPQPAPAHPAYAQPVYAQPGQAPYAPPGSAPAGPGGLPRKAVYAIVGGVVAVAAVVTTVVVASGDDGPANPREAVEQYVGALGSGDYRTAYASLCSEQRESYDGPADFVEEGEDREYADVVRGVRVTGVEREDAEEWDVELTLEVAGYGEISTSLEVVREDGGYRICSDF